MSETLALFSKKVALPEGIQPATVVIEDGKIVRVALEKMVSTKTAPVRDLGDSVIMPGIIDCNVHINQSGDDEWEGFDTATASAAAGGITTVVDMPVYCSPATSTLKALRQKIAASKGILHVNCGFWGAITADNASELRPMIEAGVLGFAAYLSDNGNVGTPVISIDELSNAVALLSGVDLPVVVHALLEKKHAGLKDFEADHYSYQAFLKAMPKKNENEAVKSVVKLCRKYGVRTHIMHLSSAEAIEFLNNGRSQHLPITAETCPHYLYFDSDKINDSDTRFKCSPPIRERSNNQALWDSLMNGGIDFITSDHSPVPAALKELDTGDFKKAVGGIAAMQFTLPVVWTLAQKNGASLENVYHWLSARPAEFLGLKTKGILMAGCDADLVVWNPQKKMKANAFNLKSRQRITPYEGEMLSGVVEETWVNGKLVYDRGNLPTRNAGKLLLNHQSEH